VRTLATMLIGMALLAPHAQAQVLSPGKPAGTKQTYLNSNTRLLLITVGLASAIVGLGVISVSGAGESDASLNAAASTQP
jgi:hypothetical protein